MNMLLQPFSISMMVGAIVGRIVGRRMKLAHQTMMILSRSFYALCSLLALHMIVWILFMPGACHLLWNSGRQEFLEGMKITQVPLSLLTKYRDQHLICFTHVFPGVLWCTAIIIQLNKKIRTQYPLLHQGVGVVFFTISLLMMAGYYAIENRGLIYYKHDFRNISAHDASSHLFPAHEPSLASAAILFLVTGLVAFVSILLQDRVSHRRWVFRHIVLGLWVSLQRVFVIILPIIVDLLGMDHRDPRVQKANFGDAGVFAIGILASVVETVNVFLDRMHEKMGGSKENEMMKRREE